MNTYYNLNLRGKAIMGKISLIIILLMNFAYSPLQAEGIRVGGNKTSNPHQTHHQRVTSGGSHVLEIRGGELWGWGVNNNTQLGVGDANNRNTPTRIGNASNWVTVSANDYSSMGIKADGTLWTWGFNYYGQLGLGHNMDVSQPTQVGMDADWVSACMGAGAGYAIKSNGTLWAWGYNLEGALGIGNNISNNSPVQVGSDSNWAFINADGGHALAIKTDGTIWGWGYNGSGAIGDGTTVDRNAPVQVGSSSNTWKYVSTGDEGTLAITSNGTLWAWGSNAFNQLGFVPSSSLTPLQVGSQSNWTMVSTKHRSSFGVKSDGTLWAWGDNTYGQLGFGNTNTAVVPTQSGIDYNWVSVSAGTHSHVRVRADGALFTAGRNQYGQLGDGTTVNKNLEVLISTLTVWQSASSNLNFTVALKSDGSIWGWGANSNGQLGQGNNNLSYNNPTRIGNGNEWSQIAAGGNHVMAIKSDGSLWAWGRNTNGELGIGSYSGTNVPVRVGSANDWISIAPGYTHSYALKSDGTLWATGDNSQGTLGNGTFGSSSNVFVQVGFSNLWVGISSGDYFAVGMQVNGSIWSWGSNGFGQLGQGNTNNVHTPTQIGSGVTWKQAVANRRHMMAIQANGTLWACGENADGRLGDGTTTQRTSLIQIGSDTNWMRAAPGGFHTCALKSNGTLWAWGNNNLGQLGIGNNTTALAPVQVSSEPQNVFLFAGYEVSGIIKPNRTTICMTGNNTNSVLGNNLISSRNAYNCDINSIFLTPLQAGSNSPICVGTNLNLSAQEYTGASYTWIAPGGLTTNTRTWTRPLAQTDMSGVYTVTASIGSNSISTTITVTVNANPVVSISPSGPTTFCRPDSITLTASGAVSYAWSNLNYTNSIIVNTSGTYSVVGTSQNGCSSNAQEVVTAHQPAPLSVFASDTTFCQGGSTILSASNGSSYLWNTGATTSTISVTSAGTYQVSAIDTNGCSSISSILSIQSIAPLSAPQISGSQTICQDSGSIYLSIIPESGATYLWTAPNGFTNSGSVLNIQQSDSSFAGIYTVSGSRLPCPTVFDTIEVYYTPYQTVSATSNSPVCEGNTINLSATFITGTQYIWSGPNSFTSVSNAPSISYASSQNAGTYQVIVSQGNCGLDTLMVPVQVAPVVSVSISGNNLCTLDSMVLTATAIQNAQYVWFAPDGYTYHGHPMIRYNVSPQMLGIYTVVVNATQCSNGSYTGTVQLTSPQQVSVVSNSPICLGSTLQISADYISGAQYFWTGPNGFTSSQNFISLSNVQHSAAGVYSVSITQGSCSPVTQTIPVLISESIVTANWTVGSGGDFATLSDAIANVNVLNGQVIRVLPGTYSVPSTIQINKSLTIVGNSTSPGQVIFQTANDGTAPATMVSVSASNVRIVGITFRHRKTTATSVETAISVSGGGFPQTRVNGFGLMNCRIEHVEFGLSIRGSNWTLKNNTIAYVEFGQPANSTRRHIGVYGLLGNSFIDQVVFEDNTLSGNTRAITPTSTTGTNPNETYEGSLVVQNCSQIGRLQQFYSQDGFQGSPGSLKLWFLNNSVNEYSLFVGFFGTSSNFGNILGPIIASGNTLSNTHATSPVGGKGLIGVDGTGAFRSSNLLLYETNNTPAQTTFRSDYVSTMTMGNLWASGRSVNIQPFGTTLLMSGNQAPTIPHIPTILTVSSNSPICVGTNLNLSSTLLSGVSYSWSGPYGYIGNSAGRSLINPLPNSSGVYSLSVSGACASGVYTTQVSISAHPDSAQVFSNSPVCAGLFLQLAISSSPDYSVSWTGPNGFTSNSFNPLIMNAQPIHSGVYTILVTTSNCGTATKYLQAQVLGAPTLTAGTNSPVCEGTSILLSASSPGIGNTFSWAGPNAFSSTTANAVIALSQPTDAGIYTATVTNSCGSGTFTTAVSVISGTSTIQASSNTPVCTGGTLQLSVDGPTGQYLWAGPNGFTGSGNTLSVPNVSGANAGIYTVTMTQGGCGQPQSTTSVTISPGVTASGTSNSPVCEGSALYLNSSFVSGASYSWSGPNGYSSASPSASISNATPSLSGIYTLTVVTPNCGTATTHVPVTVGGTLNNSNASNNGPLCSGAQLNLSGSTVSNGTYFWSGPGGFTSNLQVANRLNTQTNEGGIYTVVISSPGCGSTTRTTSVAVNSGTGPNAGSNSPVCQGNAIYLSSSNLSGGIYSWTGPNNFSSNVQFPSVSNAQSIHSGVYTLISTVPGCGAVSNVVSVVVNSPLTSLSVTSNSPVCSGNTLQLSSTSQTGYQFNWSGPSGFVSTLGSPAITNSTSGNSGVYTVIVISPGCGSTTRNISATVISAPVVSVGSNSPVCQNGAIFLTSSSHTGASYSWSGPNGFVSSLPSPTILTAQSIHSGTYSLTVTVPACAAVQATASVSVSPITSGASLLNNGPLCTGQTLNLSANGLASGVVYSWTGPNGFTSIISHPTLTGFDQVNAGVYSLSVSSPGCATTNYTTSVSHLPALVAVASVNSPVCAGSTVTLSTQDISGVSYLWAGPNGFTSNQVTPVINNVPTNANGVYTLTLSRSGCGTATTTVSLVVGAGYGTVTVQSNSPMCTGATLSVTATDAPGTTKLWTAPDGFTTANANFTRTSMSPAEAGVYTYSISSPGCGTTTRLLSVVVSALPTVSPGSNSPVCQGSVVYLTTNSVSGATYAWSGPNGFTSSTQNPSISSAQPISSGVYTLTTTISGCGSVSGTTSVLIGPSTIPVTASSNSPVCTGLNLNLSATVISGMTYAWAGPSSFTSNQAQPSIIGATALNAGMYTMTATSPGCPTKTSVITVVVSGLTITPGSNSPICQGSALNLTTNAVSGAAYSWSGPNGFVSSSQNPSISNAQPVRTGIYTLTVTTSSCGTTSNTTSVIVGSSVNALSLTSNSPVCIGNNLNLSITNRTGFSFSWTGPNGFTSNVATPVINGVTSLAAGRYTVVVVSAGCGTTTVQSSNIIVHNPGSVSAGSTSPVCLGAPIYFIGNAPSGSTYSWSGPSGFASTTQNPSRSNSQLSHAGVYTMTANVTGCGAITTTTTVVVNPCRSAEDNTSDLDAFLDNANWTVEVYPNPTESKTKVRITGWKGELPTLRVLDLLGHEVLIQGVQEAIQGELTWALDFSGISKGVYFISIQTEQGERVERVVVQ
jgi:alpha-tubulin suppressor-like RCC1 family protein